MNCVKNFGAIVSAAAQFANADIHILQDHETILVLKRFSFYFF